MPKDESRSGNPAKKAAAKKASVSNINQSKVLRLKPKGEIVFFDFQLPDDPPDVVHHIPLMQYLTLEQVQQLDNDDSISGVLDLFGSDPETVETIKSLNGEQLDELMTAWRDASALGMGES